MRINRFIASTGLASRRKADQLIEEGRVMVNDQQLTDFSYQVQPQDQVKVDGQLIQQKKPALYAFNKPRGVMSSHQDPHFDRFIYDYLPDDPSLFSIGRLDVDTEGLLLITNQGDLAEKMAHPSYGLAKTYLAIIDRDLSARDQWQMESGMSVGDDTFAPARINFHEVKDWPLLEKAIPDLPRRQSLKTWVHVTINEGQNRQVRRMFAHGHYQVQRLIRLAFGPIELEDLAVGDFRVISREELGIYDEY